MTSKIAVLISGNGSNLQAIIDAIRDRILPAEIVVVVSNKADAYGLERAERVGIPTRVHSLKPYKNAGRSRREYDADLATLLKEFRPDWVVLAGWMLLLSSDFLDRYSYRVINLHPALPGAFPGTHAIERAFAAYQAGEIKETGIMVHLVPDEQVDAGPVLEKMTVPIYSSDTVETLETRMHHAEHQVLIRALLRVIEGDE
jgi:formyltetrahydrofolate-dependent phosphoribosylglycinamide formyltransferase